MAMRSDILGHLVTSKVFAPWRATVLQRCRCRTRTDLAAWQLGSVSWRRRRRTRGTGWLKVVRMRHLIWTLLRAVTIKGYLFGLIQLLCSSHVVVIEVWIVRVVWIGVEIGTCEGCICCRSGRWSIFVEVSQTCVVSRAWRSIGRGAVTGGVAID